MTAFTDDLYFAMVGLALVSPGGAVVEFVSSGSLPAGCDGPAAGMTPLQIMDPTKSVKSPYNGVQRGGYGTCGPDFWWSGPANATRTSRNTQVGQVFNEVEPSLVCPCLWQHRGVVAHKGTFCKVRSV